MMRVKIITHEDIRLPVATSKAQREANQFMAEGFPDGAIQSVTTNVIAYMLDPPIDNDTVVFAVVITIVYTD
jgi:hypothetical protein